MSDDVISEIKAHARVLHRRAQGGELAALERLRVLPELAHRSHAEIGETRFLFALKVEHPWFGVLIDQTAAFRETMT